MGSSIACNSAKKAKKRNLCCVFSFSVMGMAYKLSVLLGQHLVDMWLLCFLTSLEPVPLAWFCFASPACSMDSQLARGFAPWTPGGYIPISTTLLIPVPTTLLIPVLNMLEISTLFIYILLHQTFFYFPVYINEHFHFMYIIYSSKYIHHILYLIISLSVVCHIFTSAHSCLVLFCLHIYFPLLIMFHMCLFPSFNTLFFHY